MNKNNRLKKLEAENYFEHQIKVVRFSNEINRLSCGGENFYRIEGETEESFIRRIQGLVKEKANKPTVTILVSNY